MAHQNPSAIKIMLIVGYDYTAVTCAVFSGKTVNGSLQGLLSETQLEACIMS